MTAYKWMIACLSCCFPLAVQASCEMTSNASLSFGQVTSYAIATGIQSTSTSTAGLQCGRAINMLTTADYAKATANSANNFTLKNAAGDRIAFTASATPDGSAQFTQGGTIDYLSPSILSLLGNTPLYLRTEPGANVSAGTYTDTLTLNWDWSICTGIAISGLCLGRDRGTGTSTVQISLVVTNDCRVSVPEIIFGAAAFPADFSPVNHRFQISCTKGTIYYVGIDSGDHPSGGRRQMVGSNSANKLQYDIFNSQTNQLWTDTVAGRVSAIGDGNQTPSQNFPFRASIYADQPAQPAGIYKDQVRVNVYF